MDRALDLIARWVTNDGESFKADEFALDEFMFSYPSKEELIEWLKNPKLGCPECLGARPFPRQEGACTKCGSYHLADIK